MSAHAVLSPSSSPRWKPCAGSVAATQHIGDTSNEYAREGTAAHTLGERALGYERQCEFWLGERIDVEYEEDGVKKIQTFMVDQEMADHVQVYVDAIRRLPGELQIEERLVMDEVYGVEGQFGTGDAVLLDYENLDIHVDDLKFGRGVQVFAEGNDQLISYGAAALKQFDMLAEWKTVTVAIHQPRLNHYDEHTYTVEEIEAWIAETKPQAALALSLIGADPAEIEANKVAGAKQCQWCPIKGSCEVAAKFVHDSVFDDFVTLAQEPEKPRAGAELSDELLGKLMKRADIIAKIASEWRAEGTRRVLAGMKVPGWKPVQGKKGARKFGDEAEAEKIMKAARIKVDDMYTKKLLTAPAADKAFAKSKPKIWAKLKPLIVQAEGQMGVAEDSDPRPAVVVAETESFADVTDDDYADLL